MSRITRRRALTAAAGVSAGLMATGAARPSAATGPRPAALSRPGAPLPPAAGTGPFDEVFEGRRIQGTPAQGGTDHHGGHGHGGGGGYRVHIDGEELHVMSNADGTWISVVNHYEPYPTPLAVARAAVVELQGADLVPLVLA